MEINKVSAVTLNGTQAGDLKARASDGQFEAHLQKAMEQKDDKELKKVCKEFESIMLSMMYKQMRATVPKSELVPEGQGQEIFQSMLDDEHMKEVAKSNGIGLADILYKQLAKHLKAEDTTESVEGSKTVEKE